MRRVKFKAVRIVGNRRVSAFTKGRYQREYPKGGRVKGEEGSFGVAVFKRKGDAFSFCEGDFVNLDIIRVLPIGRGKIAKFISRSQSDYMLDVFYDHIKDNDPNFNFTATLPQGTIFYPEVEVLD